jgi:hypothetical protein
MSRALADNSNSGISCGGIRPLRQGAPRAESERPKTGGHHLRPYPPNPPALLQIGKRPIQQRHSQIRPAREACLSSLPEGEVWRAQVAHVLSEGQPEEEVVEAHSRFCSQTGTRGHLQRLDEQLPPGQPPP